MHIFTIKLPNEEGKNTIEAMTNDLRQKTEDELEIKTIAINYFSHIFQTQAQFFSIDDALITKHLSEENVRFLSTPFFLGGSYLCP